MILEVPVFKWDGFQCNIGRNSEEHGVIKMVLIIFQLNDNVPTRIYKLPVLVDIKWWYYNNFMLYFKVIERSKNIEDV